MCSHLVNTRQEFSGATVRFGDVLDLESIRKAAFQDKVDVVVSCLASRTGEKGRISRLAVYITYQHSVHMGIGELMVVACTQLHINTR